MAVIGDVYLSSGSTTRPRRSWTRLSPSGNASAWARTPRRPTSIEALSVVKKVARRLRGGKPPRRPSGRPAPSLREPPAALDASLNTLAEARRVRGDYPRRRVVLTRGAGPAPRRRCRPTTGASRTT